MRWFVTSRLIRIYTVCTGICFDRQGWSHSKNETTSRKRLYNIDPFKPHFHIVKLGFTGVNIIFRIYAQNIDCAYYLEPPQRGGSSEYLQSMFRTKIWKISEFFIWKLSVFGGEIFNIFGLNIFYFINSRCDIDINISNKKGSRTKAWVLIEFFSQAGNNLSTLWR